MRRGKHSEPRTPDSIPAYFRCEWLPLLIVTVSGIIYNVGLAATPWFEGQLAQTLSDIIGGTKALGDMIRLSVSYVEVVLFVQAMRYMKRFYVRRFANNVSRNMKHVIYRGLVHMPTSESESVGSLMTKAISDVDTCAEGMRKFTTEVFDTGVVMVTFTVMLFTYDWRLALISCAFPPVAYIIAELLKNAVSGSAAAYKESAGLLSGETLDRISGALTYRVLGGDMSRDSVYEGCLRDYEKKAVRSGILETTMQPLYQIISLTGVVFIVIFGARNVQGGGWSQWNIAAFTTFLSCFTRLAVKSSKAAKLFNSVQKARVSWKRIKPLMKALPDDEVAVLQPSGILKVRGLSFTYPGGGTVLKNIGFDAAPGEIIGVTGAVASGKSTLGKVFLCESGYLGSIRFGGRELSSLTDAELCGTVAYMGHDTSLLSDTVRENVLLGDGGDITGYLHAVCIDEEIADMPEGADTVIGSGGVRLSGGQQARIALARTLFHMRPLIILDDPFSALDRDTEARVMANLREMTRNCIVILISHRLGMFPKLDRVLWMENGTSCSGTHDELMRTCPAYRELYLTQTGGGNDEK